MIISKQAEFLNNEIWLLTFGGGFQRAGVYSDNTSNESRKEFRSSIKAHIRNFVKNKYPKEIKVSSESHIDNLQEVKMWIQTEHPNILKESQMRLGVVQKLVNLYLKYQWCQGLIAEPPHCPFDRIIISKLKLQEPPAWTKFNDIETYEMLVNETSKVAAKNSMSIPIWELDVFARRQDT